MTVNGSGGKYMVHLGDPALREVEQFVSGKDDGVEFRTLISGASICSFAL